MKDTLKGLILAVILFIMVIMHTGCAKQPEVVYENKYIYVDTCKTLPFSMQTLEIDQLPVIPVGNSEEEVATYITDLYIYSKTCKAKIDEIKESTKTKGE